ncbi:glutamate-cysteine ligase family protein [Streptomyces virginiae]|uniref:glutamate-cysteine ligase family protein n=1 Tax=Streptomyces virginiae TaxID=1961 RepID=UPI0037F81E7E
MSNMQDRPTLGVEEEYFLVDRGSRMVVPGAAQILKRVRELLSSCDSEELMKHQIEAKTTPCQTLAQLRSETRAW